MYFGDEKIRQMARSILPSRWRGAAKVRAFIHRAARREVNQSLTELLHDPERWHDGVVWGEAAEKSLPNFVRDRRDRDKLNHFERWAVERTWQLPLSSRLGVMRGLLPDGLIGQHALQHLKHNRLITSPRHLRGRSTSRPRVHLNRGALAQLLRALLQTHDGHRALNRALRDARRTERTIQRAAGPRRLHGIHDVLPFLDDTRSDAVARDVVQLFFRTWKHTRNAELAEKAAIASRELPVTYVWHR